MKRLLAIIFLLLTPVVAHAQSGKSTIVSAINVDFADNTAGAITAALLRTITTQIVSSYVDWQTCGIQGGIIYYAAGISPTCLQPGTAGQFLRTYTTPAWENLAGSISAGTGILITGTVTPTISVSGTIVAGGPTGSATVVPSITYNALGQLTAVSTNTISASTLLDVIGSTQGYVLYRGSGGWSFLTPGTSGQVFTTGGSGANPSYTTVAGTGTVQSVTCGTGLTCSSNPITVSGTLTPTFATGAQFAANNVTGVVEVGTAWSAATIISLNAAAVITPDFAAGFNFSTLVTGAVILGNPINAKPGQTGCWYLTQGSVTGVVSTYGNWKFSGGVTPTSSVSASANDVLCYQARTVSSIFATYTTDVR